MDHFWFLMTTTRFAPSPTGRLHIGHAFSALFAQNAAHKAGGRFLLRIEDIDVTRCKPEFSEGIIEDLKWLGLVWEEPVRYQSAHMDDYSAALSKLRSMGVLYPCFCTRKEILAEVEGAGQAPHLEHSSLGNNHATCKLVTPHLDAGSSGRATASHMNMENNGPIYPGTCRALSKAQRDDFIAQGKAFSWRLDVTKAMALTGPLEWRDREAGIIKANPEIFGDVVLARKDIPTSYHLSVTVDDHIQDVELVTRGVDLLQATAIHRLLQALLGYPAPEYHHHKLLLDENGKRFAKRDGSVTLKQLRESGRSAQAIKNAVLSGI